ncbi:10337_t:CDS:1, partial [Scutellospora calospora]
QLAKEKFIPVKRSNSKYCPMRLVEQYIKIKPGLENDVPLFLFKSGNDSSVLAILAIVKYITNYTNIKGRFTVHSLRIVMPQQQ